MFYGWSIVAIAIVTGTLVYGVRHSFSVFFPSILDEFGWSRGSTAIMLSLNLLIYGSVAPVAGTLADRWKPKLMMIIGATIIAVAMAGCSLANKLWHFYLLFGVIVPVGTALCAWPLLSPTLMNWFTSKRGLILGLGQMGGGFSFTYGMVAEAMIHQLGWRHAYLALAGILVAVLLPLHFFLFHYRPEDKKLKAYGAVDVQDTRQLTPEVATTKDHEGHEWTLGQAMHTSQLWLMVVSQFTLYADCRKGRRPSYNNAMEPDEAERLYDKFVELLDKSGLTVKTGQFGAKMDVRFTNTGPVTIVLDHDA